MHRTISHRTTRKIHRAAAVHVEALESRRLLSFTTPVDGAQVNTNLGSFFIQLFDNPSSTTDPFVPLTVNNFLTYVNNGLYDGTIIHRTTKRAASFQGSPSTTLTFDSAANTITRSTGSFTAEGFQANEAITISNTGTGNDGTFGIQSVSADGKTLTILPSSGTLVQQTITDSSNVDIGVGIAVVQGGGFKVFQSSSGNQTLQAIGSFIGDPLDQITFAAPTHFVGSSTTKLTFASNSSGADTITRSSGSFLADGFQQDDGVLITGTRNNNNKVVHVASISPDGLTMTLIEKTNALVDEVVNDSSSVQLTTGLSRFNGSFVNDGFVPGQNLTISGTTHNDNSYIITSVHPQLLTIATPFTQETITDSTGVSMTAAFLPTFNGNASTSLTFTSNGISADTITRSTGSFIADRFAPDQTITITGTASNNKTFTIASVTDTTITLADAKGSATSETITDSSAVRIVASAATIAVENPTPKNTAFTVAMAQVPGLDTSQNPPVPVPGGGPNSASNQWFVNVTNNPALNVTNPSTNSGPFVTFGRVIYGQNVVLAIDNLNSFDLSASLGGNAAETPITQRNQFVNLSSVEHVQLMTVTIGQGQPENALTYTDGDGTHTTLVIKQGTATITVVGTGLSGVSSGGVVTLSGTVSQLDEIALSNTTGATSLTSTSIGGNKASDLQNLTATGPVGTIDLRSMDLIGTFTTTANAISWTGPSHTNDEKQAVPASLTVSPATTVAYQFELPAQIVQHGRSARITGSNTSGTNPRNVEGIFNIDATGTDARTRLTVHTTGRNKFVDIGGFTSDHSIDGVNARRTMNLTGPMIINGVVRRINLIGMAGATLSVTGNTKGHSLLLDSADNIDSNVFSNEPIRSILVAGSWVSSRPYPVDVVGDPSGSSSSSIQAPSIGNIITLGQFNADLKTTDAKTPIKSIFVNSLLGKCNWDIASDLDHLHVNGIDAAFRAHIAGSVKTMFAHLVSSGNSIGTHTAITIDKNLGEVSFGRTENGFGGTVGGSIKSLVIVRFAGSWSFSTLGTAHFLTAGDKKDNPGNTASLVSTADFDAKKLAIGSVRINGVADETVIQANGNIGSISADYFTDRTRVMVGIKDIGANLNSLVASPSDYLAHAKLGSLTLRRQRPATYTNSLVDAWEMGRITIGTVTLQNVGVPFGLAANSISSLSARGDNGQNLSFKNLDDPAALQQEISRRGLATGDFHIVLV